METAAETSDSTVALCHTYGGVVLSEAVAEISKEAQKKIKRLIFLAAFVPPTPDSLSGKAGKRFHGRSPRLR